LHSRMHPPEIPGASHRYVDVGSERIRLHYAEAGEGPPLLMLHGWPQHFWSWRRVVPLLADRFRMICPDLRGFGWSAAPGHGYDPDTFAADAVALLDELGIERAFLMGHDWGGFSGFLACMRHPRRFERLVSLNAPVPWPALSPKLALHAWRTWYAVLMATPLIGPFLLEQRPELVADFMRGDNEPMSRSDALVFSERLARPEQVHATQALYRRYLRTLVSAPLSGPYDGLRLTTPALLLFGADDNALPPLVTRARDGMADDLRVELVEGCGHFIQEERAELVAERAAEHFAVRHRG
jgi:pimeloyl-ACP methyl ester carboxylesterase